MPALSYTTVVLTEGEAEGYPVYLQPAHTSRPSRNYVLDNGLVRAEFDYATVSGRSWYEIGGRQGQRFRTDVFSFLPQVKLRIPGAAHFRLYGKAAAGVKFVNTNLEEELYSSPVRFAWNITPIGFEWGGQRIYGMAEICLGNVLIGGRAGIGFRF